MKSFKQDTIRYYKYDYSLDFKQVAPVTSLGTLKFGVTGSTTGGNVSGSPKNATYPNTGQYYCYTKGGAPTMTFRFYTPTPTIITSYKYYYEWGDAGSYSTFKGSNTNGNWTTLKSKTKSSKGTHTLSFSNTTPYKYYYLYIQTLGGGGADGMTVKKIQLFGKIQTITESDSTDYQFYKNGIIPVIINISDTYYAIND